MKTSKPVDFAAIRRGMASFDPSSRVEPNERIDADRAFFPDGHRGVLDFKRQLVIGNRGMGKSFWTHALLNPALRKRVAKAYGHPALATTEVVVGFNGSEKLDAVVPTTDEISRLFTDGCEPDTIWRAVLLRAINPEQNPGTFLNLQEAVQKITTRPEVYAETLTSLDNQLAAQGKAILIVFDALDRLAPDWDGIRALTKALLIRAIGLQSFRAIRAKIFMRVDQLADTELFRFPDSSKLKNDLVYLIWQPPELYGLLLFELLRRMESADALKTLASRHAVQAALPNDGRLNAAAIEEQTSLITAIAGEFMGSHKKRGRVYSWVPLHLSDAANTCSPRTFLTAWKTAAEHVPAPTSLVVDHLGLIEGVRKASQHRLGELLEDYPWIDPALKALHREFVPMSRDHLFKLWQVKMVPEAILDNANKEEREAPVGFTKTGDLPTLLNVMESVAVMEERANGKINVPDIFRVEAEILRKGGVAVPRRR